MERTEKESQKQFEISDEVRRRAESIALFMGGDYNMTVGLGPWGSGWSWDFIKNHVSMDPKDLATEPIGVVLGVASHEGDHRLSSRPEHVMDMWQEPGFSFGFNAVEDPRANESGMYQQPGSREWIRDYIERDLGEGGGLDYKGIKNNAEEDLGYVPKHMAWGAEMIRYWYEKEFDKKLTNPKDIERFLKEIPDSDVRDLVKDTILDFDEYYSTIPHSKDEMDVQRQAKRSAEIFKKKIWEKYEKLVEKSYKDQSIVSMINDMISQDGSGSGQGGQMMIIPFESLPQDVQDEIKQKMKEQAEKNKQKQDNQKSEDQQSGQQGRKSQDQEGSGPSKIRDKKDNENQKAGEKKEGVQDQAGLQENSDEGESEETEEAQVQPGSKENQKGKAKDSQGQVDSGASKTGYEKDSQGQGKKQEGEGKQQPKVPWDKLSDRVKEEVGKKYDQLPDDQKEKYKQKSKEDLENAEDEANEKLRGKMNDPRYNMTHKEHQKEEEKHEQQDGQARQAEQIAKDIEKKMEEALGKISENPYSDYLKMPEVDVIRRRMERDFKRIFEPTEDPDIRYTSQGLQPSMTKVVQREADPKIFNIFESKGRPTEKKYRFMFLIDMSGSMSGMKIEETFKSLVPIVENLNRFGIEFQVVGFTSVGYGDVRLDVFKPFEEKKLTRESRDKMGLILSRGGGGTPTVEATEKTIKMLKKRMKEVSIDHNYFITLTDGEPDSGVEYLSKYTQGLRKDRSFVTTGFGIGPQSRFVNESYPKLPVEVKTAIAKELKKNINEIGNSFNDAVEFGQVFAIIVSYMIKRPDLFFR